MSGAIGKRKVDDDASSGSDDFEAADDSKRREFEKRARQDLNQFLGSKGGDSTRGNLVKIILYILKKVLNFRWGIWLL
jgi:hypothetical protein